MNRYIASMKIPPALSEPATNATLLLRPLVRMALDRIATSMMTGIAMRVHTICDCDSDHYLLVAEGWQGYRRIYRTLAHIALAGNCLHIYEDGTIDGIVERLHAEGVPKEQIICEWVQQPVRSGAGYP